MYNWNTDTTQLEKNPEKYAIWRLEQLINYGLDGEKLDRNALLKHWDILQIDIKKREVLAYLLWQKLS